MKQFTSKEISANQKKLDAILEILRVKFAAIELTVDSSDAAAAKEYNIISLKGIHRFEHGMFWDIDIRAIMEIINYVGYSPNTYITTDRFFWTQELLNLTEKKSSSIINLDLHFDF